MNIGIIGYGTVGKAVAKGFEKKAQLHIYDPLYPADSGNQFYNTAAEVYRASEFSFICVPTPQKLKKPDDVYGEFDSSILDSCMETIAQAKPYESKIIVIASTVLPSKVKDYIAAWPDMNIVISPELLTEKNATQDFLNPDCRVIGGKLEHSRALQKLYDDYSECRPCKVGYCSAVNAAYIKYMRNAYLSMKVSMMNQFYDLFEKMDSTDSWNDIAAILHYDSRLGGSHYNIPGHDGDRGWGGKCLPKDSGALYHYATEQDIEMTLLKAALEYNKKIRKKIDWVQ